MLIIYYIYIYACQDCYFGFDSVKEDEPNFADDRTNPSRDTISDFFALYSEPGIPRHELKLKVGSVCLLMRNLSVRLGLVKNARVIVKELRRFSVLVETLPTAINDFTMVRHILPRINFEF